MASHVELTCLLLVVSALGKNFLVSGGCSGKCCRGRDMTCSTTDWRMDRVYGTCYCDEGCVKTQDCCFDYFTECPAQDCAVSDWSFWSGCKKNCQASERVRVRHVEQPPSNSGKPCPGLEQKAGCREYRDRHGNHCGLNTGPAFITSMEFGRRRPKHDNYGNPLEPGFCVEFTLQSRTPHCTVENRPHTLWMRYITEGFKVCVACEPPAMRNNSSFCHGDEKLCSTGRRWGTLGVVERGRRFRKLVPVTVLHNTALFSSDPNQTALVWSQQLSLTADTLSKPHWLTNPRLFLLRDFTLNNGAICIWISLLYTSFIFIVFQ